MLAGVYAIHNDYFIHGQDPCRADANLQMYCGNIS
jgi:hypothetical protein